MHDPKAKAAARPMTESLPPDAAAFLAYLVKMKHDFELATGQEPRYITAAPDVEFPPALLRRAGFDGVPMILNMELRRREDAQPHTITLTVDPVTDKPQLCKAGRVDPSTSAPAGDLAARVDELNKTFRDRLRGEKPAQAIPPNTSDIVTLAVAGDPARELVVLQFSKATEWFAFPPEQAVAIAEILIAKARAVSTRPLVVNIG